MKREVAERNAPTRELAQRLSGAAEVLLLWRPEIDRVELSVRDLVTGAGFHIEVAPGTWVRRADGPEAGVPARPRRPPLAGRAAVALVPPAQEGG